MPKGVYKRGKKGVKKRSPFAQRDAELNTLRAQVEHYATKEAIATLHRARTQLNTHPTTRLGNWTISKIDELIDDLTEKFEKD